MGYHRAGFDVVGVDVKPQPRYPFKFVQADAMTYPLDGFDAIHASPPCQDHSRSFKPVAHGTGWMLAATRGRLEAAGVPWVIENVPGAPMRADLKLCGCMFGLGAAGLQLIRERWFECSWRPFEMRAPCYHASRAITITGTGPGVSHSLAKFSTVDCRVAMDTDWMTYEEMSQAIPPAYTEHIGRALMEHLTAVSHG